MADNTADFERLLPYKKIRHMKKKILLAVFLLFSTLSVLIAQGPQQMPPEERAKKTVEKLKPELTLTDQQEKDITPVYTDFYTSMGKLFANGRPSPEDRQKLVAERNEKLKKTLSDDQMKKLAEVEEKLRQERRQGSGQ